MSTVTRITEHPRRPGRYIVEIDARDFATVSAEVLADAKIRIGLTVDDALSARLLDAAEDTAMYDRALNLLSFRSRSSRELQRRLTEKGQSRERAERVVQRLRDVGLIDDADFARQLTRSKLAAGASRRRVQQELFKRGVDRDIADEAMARVVEDEGLDDAASIEWVARKKWRTLESLDGPTRRRRLYAFLARRGYNADDVGRVVRQLDRGADDEQDGVAD